MSATAILIAVAAAVIVFVVGRMLLDIVLAVVLGIVVLLGGYVLVEHVIGSDSRHSGTSVSRAAESTSRSGASDAATTKTALTAVYKPHRAAVPILMYHILGAPPAGSPYPDLFLAPADFKAQMAYLRSHGFEAVTLQQVWDNWHRHKGTLPRKPVVISFDDGEYSQVRVAEPILRSYHWPAVLNLIVDHYSDKPVAIGAGAVRRLISEGWEIDSHTVHHLKLTTLSAAQLKLEVTQSRKDLQAEFKVPVNFFCYPAGFYDAQVIAAVKSAGYLAATTTKPGLAASGTAAFELPRVRIDRGLSLATFATEVTKGEFTGSGVSNIGE